jgi:hypothetical protein
LSSFCFDFESLTVRAQLRQGGLFTVACGFQVQRGAHTNVYVFESVGGFFNRLEASRKYLFGSVGVLGTAKNSVITGALIARGSEIQPVVQVAPDWESYTYERIDLDNAEQKAFFEAALAWDLKVEGREWADGKNVRRPCFIFSQKIDF